MGTDFTQQSLNHKLQTTRKIISLIGQLKDNLKQDILLQEAANTLGIPYQVLKDNLTGLKPAPVQVERRNSSLTEIIPEKTVNEEPKLEKKILSAILNNASLLHIHNREYIYYLLPNTYTDILTKLETVLQKQSTYTVSELFELLNDDQKQIASQALFSSEDLAETVEFEHLVKQLQKKHWKSIVNNIKIKLEAAKSQGDTQKLTELIHEFATLKQIMLEKE